MSTGRPATKSEVELASGICKQQDKIHELRERIKELEEEIGEYAGLKIHSQQAQRIEELKSLMQRAYDYIPKGSSLQRDFEISLKG